MKRPSPNSTLESRLLYRVKRNDRLTKIRSLLEEFHCRIDLGIGSHPNSNSYPKVFYESRSTAVKVRLISSISACFFLPLWLDYSACLTQVWLKLHGLLDYPASSGSKATSNSFKLRETITINQGLAFIDENMKQFILKYKYRLY